MKLLIIKTLEIVSYLLFFAVIAGGGALGWRRAGAWNLEPVGGAAVGIAAGFIVAVVIFGVLFLLFDIADNARRTRELLEKKY